jgi:hypothetical protein
MNLKKNSKNEICSTAFIHNDTSFNVLEKIQKPTTSVVDLRIFRQINR